jgi:hypothetical protein
MSHCHCSRCRKAHGAAFATYVACAQPAFRLVGGREHVVGFESSPRVRRPFCARCGSVVPDGDPQRGRVAVPAGCLDGDPGVRPLAHVFVGSKAPWYEIRDSLPRFDEYPPGFGAAALPTPARAKPEPGIVRGSCLCGAIAYVIESAPTACRHCHCGRCRKQRAAAHASNLVTAAEGVRFTRGRERLAEFKLPDARFFAHAFCRTCGASQPRIDPARGIAIVPMGSLDDDPGVRPREHIFVGSKAPWYEIADGLPRFAEYPPAS